MNYKIMTDINISKCIRTSMLLTQLLAIVKVKIFLLKNPQGF